MPGPDGAVRPASARSCSRPTSWTGRTRRWRASPTRRCGATRRPRRRSRWSGSARAPASRPRHSHASNQFMFCLSGRYTYVPTGLDPHPGLLLLEPEGQPARAHARRRGERPAGDLRRAALPDPARLVHRPGGRPLAPRPEEEKMTMPKQQIVSPELAVPNGHFAQATQVEARGRMVFVSGMTARNRDGGVTGVGDVTAQTHQVCQNLRAAMRPPAGRWTTSCGWTSTSATWGTSTPSTRSAGSTSPVSRRPRRWWRSPSS